jgi:hypothetical protein
MQGFIVFFLILYFCSAFAQEKKGILPFYPLAKSDLLIESEAKSLKNTIKKDHFFSELIAYKAVRENDLLICNNAGNSLNCKMLAENLFSVRRMVEGNCELINERNYRDVCFKYKEKNCSALSDWKKDVCEGFLQENIDLLEGASTFPSYKREVSERGETSKSDRLEVMASFLGFKYYNSKMACEKFGSRLPLKKKFICEVLFSTNDVDEILDKIAYDIALFTLAKQYRNTKVCEKIKDRDIKNGCLDSKVRYIQDIW